MEFAVLNPEYLVLKDNNRSYYGGDQEWYADFRKRISGCGPTNAAFIIWYFEQTSLGLDLINRVEESSKARFINLMNEMWNYVTPNSMGVSKTEIMKTGLELYSSDKKNPLNIKTLNIPSSPQLRPSMTEVSDFLIEALQKNQLVAFLNLSNGSLKNLENWHWVSLAGWNPQTGLALMYDQGGRKNINLNAWYESTKIGGGFLTVGIKQ